MKKTGHEFDYQLVYGDIEMKHARKPDRIHPCESCGKTIYVNDELCSECRISYNVLCQITFMPKGDRPGNPNAIINSEMVPDRYHPSIATRMSRGFEIINESYDRDQE